MKFDKAIVIIERDNILTEIEACTNDSTLKSGLTLN